jgi:hypothetical protein
VGQHFFSLFGRVLCLGRLVTVINYMISSIKWKRGALFLASKNLLLVRKKIVQVNICPDDYHTVVNVAVLPQ